MKKKQAILHTIIYLIFIALSVITLIPIIATVLGSFKTNMEIMMEPGRLLPKKFTLDNYIEAWSSPNFKVGIQFVNSLVYTLITLTVTTLVSAMGGYVFARGNFPGKKVVFACFLSLMFIKMGNISIYATFDVLNLLNIDRNLWSLILVKAFGVPIVNVYLVKGYVESLPRALDEAAKIDGCTFTGIFFRIIMPLLKPIIATIAIMAYQASWNDYLMPTIFTLTEPDQRTLIVGLMSLKNSDGAATSWNLMLAGSTISLVPVLVAYTIGNKYFISGLSAGAVKG